MNLLVIINFAIFIFLNIYFDMKAKRRGIVSKWNVPINKGGFILGKFSLLSCWLLFLIHAFGLQWSLFPVSAYLSWLSIVLFVIANVVVGLSLHDLGDSHAVGLPQAETALRGKGIYQVSRNPMYLGFLLLCVAACLYTLNPLIFVLTVIAAVIHRKIVLAEEAFLETRFQQEWRDYSQRVRRYL
jgi:protein-S-isoprenylcysteine O-methyltransferase Ste14